jgi:D-inositol-3-phosphate glycosyltransferase
MKHICMILFHTCPLAFQEGKETGGANVYVLELSKALAKKGYTVDVFTRCQDETQPKIVSVQERLRVIHIKAGPEKTVDKKQLMPYLDEFAENILAFSKSENSAYTVLDCHYYLSGLIGLKLQEKMDIPLFITFHTLALMKNLVARSEKEVESRERIDAEFLLAQKSQKIITPSESDREYLQYLYNAEKEKITIITPGVDAKLFSPMEKGIAKKYVGAPINHKIVLFVGRIEPLKGIDVLMYAVKILLKKNPTLCAKFWIVGGDISQEVGQWTEELQKLESLRDTLGITESVTFIGRRAQKELPYYYNSAEVVVMPSHYESFGMSAVEAMSCNIPVITTDATGVANLLDDKHQSLITSVNNPLLLAEQLEQVLVHETFVHMHDIAEHVKDLTWENAAEKVVALIKK